jgi:acetyltransferase
LPWIASARRASGPAGGGPPSAAEVSEILTAYGFPLVPFRIAKTPAEAMAAARELGYPVVLKVSSERISHKSDVGWVKVDLRNADEVGAAYEDLTSRLRRRDPRLQILVQPMVRGGREVILGMARDPSFGPILMFGLGGIFVEVLRDVTVRVHPITDMGARAMIERVKGYPLLAGARGEPPVALSRIEEGLLRRSQLISDFEEELGELDLNPFMVTERPEDCFLVDARIALVPR